MTGNTILLPGFATALAGTATVDYLGNAWKFVDARSCEASGGSLVERAGNTPPVAQKG